MSMSRRMLLASLAGASLLAAPVVAQEAITPAAASEIQKGFLTDLDSLQAKFVSLAEAIPADKFSWRPAEGVRSVGEAFMHVASEYYLFTPMAYGAAPSPVVERNQAALKAFEQQSGKDDVLKHLRESFAYARQQISALDANAIAGKRRLFGRDRTILETSSIMSADLHEHLGQLIAYARMNGVKPPWSR